jgi:hypothetical protein
MEVIDQFQVLSTLPTWQLPVRIAYKSPTGCSTDDREVTNEIHKVGCLFRKGCPLQSQFSLCSFTPHTFTTKTASDKTRFEDINFGFLYANVRVLRTKSVVRNILIELMSCSKARQYSRLSLTFSKFSTGA